MRTTIETTIFGRHQFTISQEEEGDYMVTFRPLNPKTGKPWQSAHHLIHDADIPWPWGGPPINYSTLEGARAAIAWKLNNG